MTGSGGTGQGLKARRGAWALLLVLVVGLYVGGLLAAGARDAVTSLANAALWPLVAALLLQVVVTATWPQVHRASLAAVGGRMSYAQALNVSMSAFTVSHTLPGGGAVGAAVVVERLTGFGVAGPTATASTTLTGPISLLTIASLGTVGLSGAVVTGELHRQWLVVGLALLLALAALLSVIVVGLRSPQAGDRVIRAVGRLHHRLAERSEGWQRSWRAVTEQEVSGRELLPVVAWSTVKWSADIGSLAMVFVAFGHEPRLIPLLVGFGVSQVGAAVPLTPGGVGFVEGGMVAAFTALGVTLPEAATVVLAYRMLETWLPTLAGMPMLVRTPDGARDG
jgi:putative heme transporter